MLNQALSLNSTDTWVYMLKGYALKEFSRYKEALAVLDRAISLDPTDVQVKELRSTVLQKLKQQR